MDNIKLEEFKKMMPAAIRRNISQDVVDVLNNIQGDPHYVAFFRENLLGYQDVMMQGKFKIMSYLDAVKYVSYKLMGATNISAYTRAFPDKIIGFRANGVTEKDIASYVSAYNRSKLVNLIMAQSMIPTHVLNADIYQEAINIQLELARSANSEKVRSDAANSLLVQLKPPEIKKVELDIGIKGDESVITALRETTMQLVKQQRMAMEAGAITAQDAAHSGLIIDAEFSDAD